MPPSSSSSNSSSSKNPSPGARPRILLDCDPGHDDAVAILVAAARADLVGITTVHGNAPLERTTYNARVMRDLVGIDVPIHSGADRPLVVEPKFALDVHGKSGLDGADLPAPTTSLDGTRAAEFIVDVVLASDTPIWLCPVGPLTNIALALRIAPEIADRIAGISLMGGGTYGNTTPAAEFNIWADPHAADAVFRSGARIIMAGLDLTHQLILNDDRIAAVKALEHPFSQTLAGLFLFFSDSYRSRHIAIDGAALHDPCAVLALTDYELFSGIDRHVCVITDSAEAIGQTVIDRRGLRDTAAPNVHVLSQIDAPAAWALILDALTL